MIEITLNGTRQQVHATSLDALCAAHFAHVQACATAVNGAFVPKGARSSLVLKSGDHVEVVVPQNGG